MKTKTAEQILHKYFHHFKSERTRDLIVKAMEEYRQQPSASQPMSAEQVFPSWEDATKGITDSRFTELPEKNTIRQGARIMYDMLYRMMKSTAPTVKADGWVSVEERLPEIIEGKDYSENVIAWCNGQRMIMCRTWVDAEPESGIVWANCYGNIDGDGIWDEDYMPTHWQPLPPPPTVNIN